VPTDVPPGGYRVHLDAKRRPTLPADLLKAAGLTGVTNLVARVDGPGRIVLEDPGAMLAELQHRLASSLAEVGDAPGSVVDSLLANRAGRDRQRP